MTIRAVERQDCAIGIRSSREVRRSQAQVTLIATPDADALIGQHFRVLVVSRGDVDYETACHNCRDIEPTLDRNSGARVRPLKLSSRSSVRSPSDLYSTCILEASKRV